MNIHLPASLVFTKIAGFWPFWPIPNPFLGTISAVACHVVVGDAPADDFWMKWAFCLNFLIIVCYTPYISWIIMIHELGIPIIWVFHCFFPHCSIIVAVQTTCKQTQPADLRQEPTEDLFELARCGHRKFETRRWGGVPPVHRGAILYPKLEKTVIHSHPDTQVVASTTRSRGHCPLLLGTWKQHLEADPGIRQEHEEHLDHLQDIYLKWWFLTNGLWFSGEVPTCSHPHRSPGGRFSSRLGHLHWR